MQTPPEPAHVKQLSIVIPARNAGSTIDACLCAIMEHVPCDRGEVIVVDNGSTDDTRQKASRYPVQLQLVPDGFVSRVRNVGARRATKPLLAFVDSDCVVRAGWYEAIISALADPTVGIAGRRHELPDNPTWVERAWQSAHSRTVEPGLRDVPYIPAGNLACRREVFFAVGGFDESLETGEDPDLCARVAAGGLRVVESSAIRCVHLGEPKTLRDVYRRERWHGRGARFRYGDGRVAPVTFATIAFAVLVLSVPILALALTAFRAAFVTLVLLPLLVPTVYAWRYSGPGHRERFPRLFLVYLAYFSGRASALPVVLLRNFSRPLQSRRTRDTP